MQLSADFLLIFAENLIFQNMLGLPGIALTKKNGRGILRLGLLTLLFCTFTSGMTALLRPMLPQLYEKLLFPVLIAVVNGALYLLLILAAHFSVSVKAMLLPQLHYAVCSSAVLGTALLSTEYTRRAGIAFRYGFRMGLGYFAACLLLKLAAPVCFSKKIPRVFRGWRSLLLYAALLSMASLCMFPS